MKLKKIAHRLAGGLMAGALMVSMLGMTAFAEPAASNEIVITKKIDKDANVYAPKADFTFKIAQGQKQNSAENIQSPEGGLYFKDKNTISSAPTDGDIGVTSITVNNTISLAVDISKFTAPGVYRYTVSEVEPETDAVEGVGYDDTEVNVDVYIGYENGSDELSVLYYIVSEAEGDAKKNAEFTNTYKNSGTEDGLYTLTIQKKLEGNMADKNKLFAFKIKVDGDVTGEQYNLVAYDENGNSTSAAIVSDDANAVTFYLKGGQTAYVYGLSKNDTYTISEDLYTEDGYTTYVAKADVSSKDDAGVTKGNEVNNEKEDITENSVVTFVNYKDAGNVNTGLILNIAPYILMVALAGVLAFFFLRRRKSEF